jgi:hypothetical protein
MAATQQDQDQLQKEGTVAFWIKHEHPDWATNSRDYRFAIPNTTHMKLVAIKHGDGTIEIILDGPGVLQYRRRVPMPPPSERGVFVVVQWKPPYWGLSLNAKPVPDEPPKQMEQGTIKLISSPFHGPEVVLGLAFSAIPPWSEKSVTLLVAPNIVDFKEQADVPGVKVRQIQVMQHTADTKTLSLDFQAHPEETVFIQGNKVKVRLLTVGKERHNNQDFPSFELLVTSNEPEDKK